MPAQRQTLIASLIIVVVFAALMAGVLARPPAGLPLVADPSPTVAARPPLDPTPLATAAIAPTPLPAGAAAPHTGVAAPTAADADLYAELLDTPLPDHDRLALAVALGRVDPDAPPSAFSPRIYHLHDRESFWIHNRDDNTFTSIEAELMAVSEYAFFWVDTSSSPTGPGGELLTPDDWIATGIAFDTAYDAVRGVFGFEDSPGIDGSLRLHILNTDNVGRIGGYFSGADTVPVAIAPYSNQREMFVMSIDGAAGIGSSYYNATLAHEFQHMVHFNQDPDEDLWLNEGLSKLAQQVAGLRGDENAADYLLSPDQSLWFFGNERQDYGHAYLLVDYLYEQFGPDFISDLVADPANGFASLDAALQSVAGRSFDDVYADFLLALYLNDPTLSAGRYAFQQAQFTGPRAAHRLEGSLTAVDEAVNQYGLDVIRIPDAGGRAVVFQGDQVARLLPVDAASGVSAWWSNRREMAAPTLTRAVDLTGVRSAELTFKAWHNIEPDWDYAYVLASTDDGVTWTPIDTTLSTAADPHGANLGSGITGYSGGIFGVPEWVDASTDLSPYAGQRILLRFLLVTDEGVTHPGLLLDDIAIPAIGFFDDAESLDPGWQAEGFVRSHNRVPQHWLVLAITRASDDAPPAIARLDVIDGRAVLPADPAHADITLLISGLTRFTTETAAYHIDLLTP